MPLRRTEAIVLRTYRVGEADKVVVFLTRDLGKIRGLAKGARRPRSRFGGSLEVATEVELVFFEKEGRELVSVDRCDIIRSRFSCSGDPIRACTLAYFAELVDSFAQEREPPGRLYRLLQATVDSLAGGSDPEQTARYFEAWLLRLVGLYPRGEICAACGAALASSGAYYLIEERELRCRRCAHFGIELSPESFQFLQRIWLESPRDMARPAGKAVLQELSLLHQKLIVQQLEKELRSQQVLQDLLRAEGQ